MKYSHDHLYEQFIQSVLTPSNISKDCPKDADICITELINTKNEILS